MHARRLLPCCLSIVSLLINAPLWGQGEVATAAAGTDYQSFALVCPSGTLMIGASGYYAFPETIVCSTYDGDGHRFGSSISQSFPPSQYTLASAVWELFHPSLDTPKGTVDCPDHRAVSGALAGVSKIGEVVQMTFYCAGVGPTGGRTISSVAGALSNNRQASSSTMLECPGTKFAHGVAGRNGGIALLCIDAPLIANAITGVGLSTQHAVSGTNVSGTVVLDGYVMGPFSVSLSVSGATGVTYPSIVNFQNGQKTGVFQLQSIPSTAGCATVTASLPNGTSTKSAPLTFTPAPPPMSKGYAFSFALQPASASLVWNAPSTIVGVVAVSGSPSVSFDIDHPDVLAIQRVQQGTDTVKVVMNALKSGCAVVSAIVDGIAFRKTLRIFTGL